MSHYQYTISFNLAEDCPPAVLDFFAQLDAGSAPPALPEADEGSLESSPAEVIGLLGNTSLVDRRVTITGGAEAAAFYMPFMALCEWLARYAQASGPVGYYHHTGSLHPTLLYFSDAKPYMLQATGTPRGLADGEAMSDGD